MYAVKQKKGEISKWAFGSGFCNFFVYFDYFRTISIIDHHISHYKCEWKNGLCSQQINYLTKLY